MRRVHLDKSHIWSKSLDEGCCRTRHDVVCPRLEIENRHRYRGQFFGGVHIQHRSKSWRRDMQPCSRSQRLAMARHERSNVPASSIRGRSPTRYNPRKEKACGKPQAQYRERRLAYSKGVEPVQRRLFGAGRLSESGHARPLRCHPGPNYLPRLALRRHRSSPGSAATLSSRRFRQPFKAPWHIRVPYAHRRLSHRVCPEPVLQPQIHPSRFDRQIAALTDGALLGNRGQRHSACKAVVVETRSGREPSRSCLCELKFQCIHLVPPSIV